MAVPIQDEAEVIRWFTEGRTYAWMAQEYERTYNLSPDPSAFGDFRRRHGLSQRITGNDALIPWAVAEVHRWDYDLALLRMEARRRAGSALNRADAVRLAGFLQKLADTDMVLHYDPDTVAGFSYVPRRPGIDLDLIREPRH